MTETEKQTPSELAEKPPVTITHKADGWLIVCGDSELSAQDENMLAVLAGTLLQDDILHRKELRRLEGNRIEWEEAIRLAEKHGWNGVENSKFLSVWLDCELTEKRQQQKRITELEEEAAVREAYIAGYKSVPGEPTDDR